MKEFSVLGEEHFNAAQIALRPSFVTFKEHILYCDVLFEVLDITMTHWDIITILCNIL